MTTEPKPLPKWKIDTMEAAIQDLQRVKVSITASRIHKRSRETPRQKAMG